MTWDQLRLEMLEDLTDSSGSGNAEGIDQQDMSELELIAFDGRSHMGQSRGAFKNEMN